MKKFPSFFIQARLSSSRLSKKIITPIIQNKSIIDLILERILYNFPSHNVYVLTTTSNIDDLLVEHLKNKNITVFRGSEENVLDRFVKAGELYGEFDIIRICADNPFLLSSYLYELVNSAFDGDYLSFSFDNIPVMKCHFGFFAERITLDALKKASAMTEDPLYLEHVTNYVYGNPQIFNIKLIDKTKDLKSVEQYRLTVDTREDFQTASIILSYLENFNNISLNDIRSTVENNTYLYQHMINEKIKNSK